MIRIDHIEFGFAVPDESFARGLYADWDSFCRRCFNRVAEECLAPYGDGKAFHELERLDLDLGSIPEETFYEEYPRRLREALLAALPPLHGTRMQPDPERTAAAWMNNLLHYLRYGYPLPEWKDSTFDLQEEADWLAEQPAAFYNPAIEKLASLCTEDGYAARRLLWQVVGGKLLLDVYATVLSLPSAGLQGKKRFLTLLLETRPDIPLRYVHGALGNNDLSSMAELLDSSLVRILIHEEAGEHAEVDLSPYWHYLYEWLIRYYPFNGIAVFGSKAEFIRHLHHRLLTFIRKRNYSFYLSKEELTAGFLSEVFGSAYYIDVLNTIYKLQPHNPDGSPVHDNYFNRELYRLLLLLPGITISSDASETKEKKKEGIPGMEKILARWKSPGLSAYKELPDILESHWQTAEGFREWLGDAAIPDSRKQELLQIAATEYPQKWTTLLREFDKDGKDIRRIAVYMPASVLSQSISRVSFHQAAVLSRLTRLTARHAETFSFLFAGGKNFQSAISEALLLYMQDADTLERTLTEKDIVEKFLTCLHFVYTGKREYSDDTEWQQLSYILNDETGNAPTSLSDKEGNDASWRQDEDISGNAGGIILPPESLTDDALPEAVRKRLLQNFLRLHPDGLLEYIRRTTAQGILSVEQWAGLLDTDDWMRLASVLSLSTTELLRQTSGIMHLDDEAERLAWASCIINGNKEEWRYNRPEEHVRHFVQAAMPLQGEAGREETLARVLEELHIQATEDAVRTSEIIWVTSAGLCLLAPWFVRLFSMLGYLDEEKRNFRDTASKVRAVFLLQYLVCGKERDWREAELAFNRLLTALPGNVPLPKYLPLTDEERQTADSMVAGVKANWPQMDGTSPEGFRHSFLLRDGMLEEEEGHWLLTVEEKAYDILLDTVPWGFRQIRLPWLKKYVQVKWHEKQVF